MGKRRLAVLDFRHAQAERAGQRRGRVMATSGAKNGFEVRPLSGSVGAEILGIDLSAGPGHNAIAAIRQTWLEHGVVFFRDQDLPPAKFLAFAKQFGDVVEYPFIKGIEGFPEIIPVVKLEHETKNFGGIWHTDTAYIDKPPMATMLIAREVPPYGGDTLFANMYTAYETLSDGMKRMLDGLIAVNYSAKADVTRTREDRIRDGGKAEAKKEFISEHPVVRTHPETGRKALYVNVGHTARFKDMTEEESAPLLNFLFQHQTKPEFTCRFNWRVGSMAFWDNRCVLHNPVNDYHGHRRVMHRVTLAGDKPR
jgi:taurine dioxygenase